MIVEIQESAKKDLKKIDRKQAIKILKQIKNLENNSIIIVNIKHRKEAYQ